MQSIRSCLQERRNRDNGKVGSHDECGPAVCHDEKCMVQLQEEGKLDSETLCFRVEDGSRWDQEWEKYLKDADAVFVKWMGSTLKTDFWKKCRRFLERNRIPYLIDAAGSDEPQADFMVDPDTAARIHQYTVYSGMKNYRNLYLYGASVFCGSRIPWEEPGPVCWAGLYHPGLPLLLNGSVPV